MKKLISILLFSAISANSYAFKIISQEFTHSPGIEAGFEGHSVTTSALNTTLSPKYVQATVEADYHYARPNETIKLASFHEIIIENLSSTYKTYNYHYLLKCNGNFAELKQTITLDPNERRVETEHLFISFLTGEVGKYPLEAITEVSGAEKAIERSDKAVIVMK